MKLTAKELADSIFPLMHDGYEDLAYSKVEEFLVAIITLT